jgi:hypothetical protein
MSNGTGDDPLTGIPLPRLSRLALVSFILGLLFFVPLVGLFAIVIGVIALGSIGNSEGLLRGKGLATTGIILGLVSIPFMCLTILATLALIAHGQHSALEQSMACRSNLKQIGIAVRMYKDDTGQLPPNFQVLVDKGLISAAMVRCTADAHAQPARAHNVDATADYYYADVKDATGLPQPVPVAWDRYFFHGARNVNVLFANGDTKLTSIAELAHLLKVNAFRYGKPPQLPRAAKPAVAAESTGAETSPALPARKAAPPALWDLRLETSSPTTSRVDSTAAALRLKPVVDSTHPELSAKKLEAVYKRAIFTFQCKSTGQVFRVTEEEFADPQVYKTFMVDYGQATKCRVCGQDDAVQSYYCPDCKRYYPYEQRHETTLVITCPKGHRIPQEYH